MTTARYPGDIFPPPALCWSTEKLVSGFGGFPMIVQNTSSMATTPIPFAGDTLDQAVLTTAIGANPFGRVGRLFNQIFGVGDAVSAAGIRAPRIAPGIKIGASSCLLFEGGTNSGDLYGLDILPSLQAFGIGAGACSVMAVLRPTSSIYRNQQSTPALSKGTILSLEAAIPFQGSGKTTLGSSIIENVTPIASLVPGSLISGLPFPSGVWVISISPTGPDTANVEVFGSSALATFEIVSLLFTTPVISFYQNGDASPGSFAASDNIAVAFEPQTFSGCEIRPSVVSWTSNRSNTATDVVGMKSWQNELVQSSPVTIPRNDTIINGYIGRMGGSTAGGQNLCGDFWLAALLVWNRALSQAQRAIVADSLYRRFAINELRSIRSAKSVTVLGDSIAMDYVTLGNYGWSKRLADKFPNNVRCMNYAVAGSQVIASEGMPVYGYTEGMFPISVARQMSYSKVSGKNCLIILAGGNDMTNFVDYYYTALPATDEIAVYQRPGITQACPVGTNVLHFASVPLKLAVGAVVTADNGSIPPSTTVVSSTDTTITLSANIIAPGLVNGDFTTIHAHNMEVGNRLLFLNVPIVGVPTVTGITTNVVYYVKTITAIDRYKVSATPSGPVIDIGGTFSGQQDLRQYPKTAAEIFGTPTTHGLQKIVADTAAASPGAKVFICTVLPRVGLEYNFILQDLNALIMAGGAGGYQAVDSYSLPAFADQNVPPGHIGTGFADGGHLNETGSQALADFLFPIVNGYLNS
jgi:lysophospholipase L1-like esterase